MRAPGGGLATGGRDAAGTNAPAQHATPGSKAASPVLPERRVALERQGISESVVPGAGARLTATWDTDRAGAVDTPAVALATLPRQGAFAGASLGLAERVLVDRYFALMRRQKVHE